MNPMATKPPSPLPGKPVSASAVSDQVYQVFPNDLNANDTVFGGRIMAMMDRLAAVVADRHSGRVCVTVSVDNVHFLAPAKGGDTLVFSASVNRAWNTSMEIGVRVLAENNYTRQSRHILSAYMTFVAVDADNKPVPVPPVIPETPEQKSRYEEAQLRRASRLAHSESLEKLRAKS
jgi:acyl-CoA hydrolase